MNNKTGVLLIALICLGVHSAACLFADTEIDQNILNQKSAEKIQLQQDTSNASHPVTQPLSFYEVLEKAEQGNAQAEYLLGRRYYFGEGVTQDREKAAQWHTKAADQGHATAQYVLGLLYSTGDGVHQDKKKAVGWITRAAGQGLAEAQFALGMMYQTGEDVPQDTQKASELISKAAAQGSEEARKKAAEYKL
ncbi:tetratricopeptide repeat protein [uncultured Desulfobulbus sp.]|uniref:tetratricopeptide repeat protein n=1 Tax=uncultured Desulfobulbus sp. TaxID=239745 RepID=UPI0029C742C8|nr:tetratricopeptide repeat protein [uncultured Desulfobulbus sp.]